MRKTKKMLAVEERLNRGPLEDWLPEEITKHGQTQTQGYLGISKATLGYWLLKLGLTMHRVCLRPNESITINRKEQ